MIYVLIGTSLLLLAVGFIVTKNNAKYLLAGYNTMGEEERKKIDIAAYIQYFRRFHLILGISFLAIGATLFYAVGQNAAGIFLAVYPLLAYIYFMWSSARYTRAIHTNQKKIAGIILGGALVFVLVLLFMGFREDQLTVADNTVEISGLYGEKLEFNDIQSVELIDRLPPIKMKTNGFALGTINKGYFKTADGEVVKLILNSRTMPCILITRTNGKRIYYSSKSIPNSQLFESLKGTMPGR